MSVSLTENYRSIGIWFKDQIYTRTAGVNRKKRTEFIWRGCNRLLTSRIIQWKLTYLDSLFQGIRCSLMWCINYVINISLFDLCTLVYLTSHKFWSVNVYSSKLRIYAKSEFKYNISLKKNLRGSLCEIYTSQILHIKIYFYFVHFYNCMLHTFFIFLYLYIQLIEISRKMRRYMSI